MAPADSNLNNDTAENESFTPGESVYDMMSNLEVICEDYIERYREGTTQTVEEFAALYPSLESQLLELLPTILLMERARGHKLGKRQDGRVQSDPNQPPELGEFRIIREIGRGGMGIVYEAHQASLDRRVAIKVLPKMVFNRNQITQFRHEASVAAKLHHTNIAPVYGVGEKDDTHFFAMQLLEGQTLETLIKDGHKFRSENVVSIGMQVASALHYAHEQGVYHRDIKPSNLILDNDQHVWVTDFGLAISRETTEAEEQKVSGTLRYMPPESFRDRLDTLANLESDFGDDDTSKELNQLRLLESSSGDIYALGITLIELLLGKPAFDNSSPRQLREHILQGKIAKFETRPKNLSNDLFAVLKKAVHVDPNERYTTARAFENDLANVQQGRAVSALPFSILGNVWRWSKRNSALAKVLIITGLLVYAVAMISSFAYYNIDQALKVERGERIKVENQFDLARSAIDEIFQQYAGSIDFQDPTFTVKKEPENELDSIDTLKKLIVYYDRFSSEQAANVDPKLKSIYLSFRMGCVHSSQGQHELALIETQKAVDQYTALRSTVQSAHPSQAIIREAQLNTQLGKQHRLLGQSDAAQACLNKSLELLNSLRVKNLDLEMNRKFELAYTSYELAMSIQSNPTTTANQIEKRAAIEKAFAILTEGQGDEFSFYRFKEKKLAAMCYLGIGQTYLPNKTVFDEWQGKADALLKE